MAEESGEGAACEGLVENASLDGHEQALLLLINAERAAHDLELLVACKSLSRAAQGFSDDLLLGPTAIQMGPSEHERACDACYEAGCGSDVLMATDLLLGSPDAQSAFEYLREAPTYQANLLAPHYKVIGIGRTEAAGKMHWANVFASGDEPSCY